MTEEEEGIMDLFTNVMGRERIVFYILDQRHIFQTWDCCYTYSSWHF